MPKRMPTWTQIAWRVGMIVIVCVLLSACNLGQPVSGDPLMMTPTDFGFGQVQDPMGLPPTPTETALFQVPPTATPEPALLPAEELGPIAVDGTTHRTQEPVTVRVRVGQSVSTVTCTYLLQDTNQTTALGTPTTQAIDENTSEQVYTFTPQAAGTYQVNCTGIALTISGQRAVSSAGLPFAVEAKG